MMNPSWRNEQHPSFINFISSFLSANSYRLNFLPISPVSLSLFLPPLSYTDLVNQLIDSRTLSSTMEDCL